jgi:hypothetical protein
VVWVAKSKLMAVALSALAAACDDDVELPAAPEVDGIEAAYQAPTGSLAPEQLACAAADAVEQYQGQHLAQLRLAMTDALADLRQRLIDVGLPVGDEDEQGDEEARRRGWLRLQRTCRGWDPAATAVDPTANGTITLTAVVDDSKLARVLWGVASGCRERVQVGNAAAELFFDGTLVVVLDRGLPESADQTRFIFQLQGQAGVGQARGMADVDFRATFPAGREANPAAQQSSLLIELRLPRPDGDVIAGIGSDGVTLRARNGTFTATPEDCVASTAGRSAP